MVSRYYYADEIRNFLKQPVNSILGQLSVRHEFSLQEQQRNAWIAQIQLLQLWLVDIPGTVVFEYKIPRMGRRIDAVVLSGRAVFAIEFKVGAESYDRTAMIQATDYALDLKNFHAHSQFLSVIPVLICTQATDQPAALAFYADGLAKTQLTNGQSLASIIAQAQQHGSDLVDAQAWLASRYTPTPTIIEAAQVLYRGHSVAAISRSDAGAENLSKTATTILNIINSSKQQQQKSICFLTGVPGAGKTLAGLNLASSWQNGAAAQHAVFLSGNGPLVDVLREALTRSELTARRDQGFIANKAHISAQTKAFIQNIHHFRDDALADSLPPIEHVVVFDEAQRAWNRHQTASFMKRKKGIADFALSEPEFLIGVLDRHSDWATVICLIGGGQEINTGEAGLSEWFLSLQRSFPHWQIHISSRIADAEYTQDVELYDACQTSQVVFHDDLHLAVSIRSFRSEKVADFVKATLDCDTATAQKLYRDVSQTYPIYVTRNIQLAKSWLRAKARGSERYGLLASSGALRLKSFGLQVQHAIDPVYWFLNDPSDVRSSCFLEDVATEFDVQGLELDWTCVAWDADLRYDGIQWLHRCFKGTKWQTVKNQDAKRYLKNAYRVLLTRARQGMIIFVPQGCADDPTRLPELYDPIFEYLIELGVVELGALASCDDPCSFDPLLA